MEDKIVQREKQITDKLSEIMLEWTELKIKLLCREQKVSRLKRDLNVAVFCMSGIIICLVILLIIGVE